MVINYKNRFISIFSYSIVLIIFLFLGKILIVNWNQIKDWHFFFNYFYLILAFIFTVLNVLFLAVVWRYILRKTSNNKDKLLSPHETMIIFLLSWIGKYIPGKIFTTLGKIYLANQRGISKKTLVITSIFELLFSILAHIFLVIICLILFIHASFYYIIILSSVLVAGIIIVMSPNILFRYANKVLLIFKRGQIKNNFSFSRKTIALLIFLYCVAITLKGIAFIFLVLSFISIPFNNYLLVVAYFIVAAIIGKLAIVMPGGLGFREGALVLFLSFIFSKSLAVLISVASGIWFVLVDIVLFLVAILLNKILTKKLILKEK